MDFSESVGGTLTDESPNDLITSIRRVKYPQGLKIPTARLIQYFLSKDALKGLRSENIVSYAVQYADSIPNELIKMLSKYRKLSW